MSINAMKQAIEAINEAVAFREGGRQKAIDAINALRTAIQQAESEPVGAREALERIASWSEHPAMLGVDYGSNGVRDYYRKIARDALTQPAPGVPDDVVRDAERWRTFLATRPSNTHEGIIAAIDAASPAQKGGE